MDENEKAQIWKDYSLEHWNDWKWQIKNRITDTEQLSKIVHLKKEEKEDIEKCLQKFKMAITPYYAALIDDSNPDCPIRKQAIPSAKELIIDPCEREDPLCEEKYSPVPGLVHRYPDRVLLVLTHKCSMYCRHCTRRRLVGCEDYSISDKRLEAALEYIRKNTVIRDVLLSGGDPLVMPDARLEGIIKKVREIPHVEIIRIGTRTPVVLPMRITDELLNMLKKYHPLWINTHINHPKEITKESSEACRKIVDAGIPLGNQSVLLRGVNDDTEILKALFLKLVSIRVRPYYLYQCDVSQGIGHFRTKVSKGMEMLKSIRGNITGFAVPEYVIDAPGGGGKTPVNRDYIVDMTEEGVTLRNFEGKIFYYPNPKE